MEKVELGIYRHYKGGFYVVLGVAPHTETGEELVFYRGVKDGKFWIRPKSMFLEKIVLDGKETPRFKKLV